MGNFVCNFVLFHSATNNVELVGVKDGVVSVRLTGACGCCPMSTMTLKNGIERMLKSKLPEVKEVVSV